MESKNVHYLSSEKLYVKKFNKHHMMFHQYVHIFSKVNNKLQLSKQFLLLNILYVFYSEYIYMINIRNTVPIDYTTGIKEKRNERPKENEKYALYIHSVFCIV